MKRLAVLNEPVAGKFSRWRRGEYVYATHGHRGRYLIERVKWKIPALPLLNQCTGVPRAALEFVQAGKPIKITSKSKNAARAARAVEKKSAHE